MAMHYELKSYFFSAGIILLSVLDDDESATRDVFTILYNLRIGLYTLHSCGSMVLVNSEGHFKAIVVGDRNGEFWCCLAGKREDCSSVAEGYLRHTLKLVAGGFPIYPDIDSIFFLCVDIGAEKQG